MNPLFLLQGIGMVGVALLAVLYWKVRQRVPASLFLWGGLSWFVAIVLKSIAGAPTLKIAAWLRGALPELLSEPLLWLYIGLLTGVFESLVALVVVARVPRLRASSWHEAIGYGLGFGALEAILLGVYSTVIVYLTIAAPEQLPPELLDLSAARGASPLAIPLPVLERAIVIPVHVFSALLIIHALQRREMRWFWASFTYKTALDAVAGYIQLTYGVQNLTLAGAWLVELVLLPLGLVGIWGCLRLRDRWRSGLPDMRQDAASAGGALRPQGAER
jgi:uncharacterized membrane protein YhfC